MKRRYCFLFILLHLLLCGNLQGYSQSVYNQVLRNAERIIQSPSSNVMDIRINQFKRAELLYLKRKTEELNIAEAEDFLDSQAYCMSEFISLFLKEAVTNTKLTTDERKDKILLFIDASCSNPLFNDPNKKEVDAYIEENELTPFCLDTDWEKAYAAATSQLK